MARASSRAGSPSLYSQGRHLGHFSQPGDSLSPSSSSLPDAGTGHSPTAQGFASPPWLDTADSGPLWWLHSPCLLFPGQSPELVSPPCGPPHKQHPWPTFTPIPSGKPTLGPASLPVGAQLCDVGLAAHPLWAPGLSPTICPLEAPAHPQYLQPASCLKQHRSSCVSPMRALGLWSPSPRRDRTQGRAAGVPQEPGIASGGGLEEPPQASECDHFMTGVRSLTPWSSLHPPLLFSPLVPGLPGTQRGLRDTWPCGAPLK